MRKIIFLVVLALLVLITGYVYWNFYNVKSDGTRNGLLQKFSRKGNMFKTWEGDMIMMGFGRQGTGNYGTEHFFFSVNDDAIADSLEHHCQGKMVSVHYLQYRRSLAWRGENYNGRSQEAGQYVVDRIEEVREVPY